jgi:hypothetical protein
VHSESAYPAHSDVGGSHSGGGQSDASAAVHGDEEDLFLEAAGAGEEYDEGGRRMCSVALDVANA